MACTAALVIVLISHLDAWSICRTLRWRRCVYR